MHRFALPALAGVVVLALAGCGGTDDKADSESSTAPSSVPSTPATSAAPAVPSPDAVEAEALKTVLNTLKPGIGSDDDAISNARNVCLDIKQGKDDETAAKNAAARYGTDEVIGAAIVATVKTSFCS